MTVETTDDLKAAIADLNRKLVDAENKEDQVQSEALTFPLARVHLTVARGLTVFKEGITAPELLVLCNMFRTAAGGNPILDVKRNEDVNKEIVEYNEKNATRVGFVPQSLLPTAITVEAHIEKRRLIGKYGGKVVNALFPGNIPQFPKTFRQALTVGMSTSVATPALGSPDACFMTMNLTGE